MSSCKAEYLVHLVYRLSVCREFVVCIVANMHKMQGWYESVVSFIGCLKNTSGYFKHNSV